MNRKIPLFNQLEIETSSFCNRVCPSCIRNSHPDRQAVKSWFEHNLLPIETIEEICKQAVSLGFYGLVCLQHFNEPLEDPRIVEIGQMVKSFGFSHVFFCSNVDLMDDSLACDIDGVFDSVYVALYNRNEEQRLLEESSLLKRFKKTRLHFTKGFHIPTHFSPSFNTESLIRANAMATCSEPFRRMVINHKGQMLLCCDDMIGNFNLGNFPDMSLEDLWYSDRHQDILISLKKPGGRMLYPYCKICPRGPT